MKKQEEKLYYQWLEDVIRKRTNLTSFFRKSQEEHDAEIMLLVNYIREKNPKLFNKLLAKTLDATDFSTNSRNDIYNFLSKTEKGTAVTWKDKDGNEFVFVNAGEGSGHNKKRIIIYGNNSKKDLELFKKTLFAELLRKDVEHTFKKIQRKTQKTYSQKFYSQLFDDKQKMIHTSGSFEKNFKNLIREQGSTASPIMTAQVLVKSMSGMEKKQLQNAFTAMGVKNGKDLQRVLNRWKTEALTNKMPRRRVSIQNNIGRSM